ncbi:hypothetical protein C8J57DRAFT_1064887 [Mycena rebaudengoi]|nr:hypothetical protein C8J57DRAFT_1077586 [Mycena rebaudengoi]KAJ7265333.1 hypothetical protein C8J57DRAFT_1069571 [Mycena rebaudengoi]KAJ7271714.1 hypothetical protein C8J57DRAFT_1064965 [Mycena rebaudengoi]KAJ7271800.1 hypothetical protein C8J57DRAFT_1064887 [Mycena rebaudengoi]
MSPRPSAVPLELVDRVIDHLATDRKSLRICCLVARSWLPRSRWHLFCAMDVPLSRLPRFIRDCDAFFPGLCTLTLRSNKWSSVIAQLPALRVLGFRQRRGYRRGSLMRLLLDTAQSGAFKSVTRLHVQNIPLYIEVQGLVYALPLYIR